MRFNVKFRRPRAASLVATAVATAAVVALLGAACGSGADDGAADSPPASPEAPPASADDGVESAADQPAGESPARDSDGDGDEPTVATDGGDSGAEAAPSPPPAADEAVFETVPAAPTDDAPDDPAPAPDGAGSDADGAGSDAGGSDAAEPLPGDAGDDEPPANVYNDPRGAVFAEFQRGFDRDHPFQSLDAFCLPHEPPAEPLRATDAGISADSITLVHLRTKIEEVVDLGFAAPVGDPTDMFDTFTRIVNERCGGIRGRQVDLRLVEVPALGVGGQDIDTLRNAACIEATEGHEGVILLNATSFQGTALLCIAEEHNAAFLGHQTLPEEYVRRGAGRLLTTATTVEENLAALARYLIDSGALAGKRVGIVAPNTPGEVEAVEGSLLAVLTGAGVDVAVFDVIDCAGTSICTGGMAESVQRLIEEGVDVVFPSLNAVSLPAYINEMTAQGFRPGDVQFYNSDFNSQGNEVVNNLVVTFGGAAAGELYNGAVLLTHGDAGRYRTPGWGGPSPFDAMCMREYRENSASGTDVDYDPADPAEVDKFATVGLVCTVYRTALRALYDAGPNPDRAAVFAALENLGAVDLVSMLPGSLSPGKWTVADALIPVTFRYPCPFEGLGTNTNMCLVPADYSQMRVKVN